MSTDVAVLLEGFEQFREWDCLFSCRTSPWVSMNSHSFEEENKNHQLLYDSTAKGQHFMNIEFLTRWGRTRLLSFRTPRSFPIVFNGFTNLMIDSDSQGRVSSSFFRSPLCGFQLILMVLNWCVQNVL